MMPMTPTQTASWEELYGALDTMQEYEIPKLLAFINTLDKCQPNDETIAALEEADRIIGDPNVKAYTDLNEMFAELRAECIKCTK